MQMDSLTCDTLAEAGTPYGSTECLSIGRVCLTRSVLNANHEDVNCRQHDLVDWHKRVKRRVK
jgi:hypothetical protein